MSDIFCLSFKTIVHSLRVLVWLGVVFLWLVGGRSNAQQEPGTLPSPDQGAISPSGKFVKRSQADGSGGKQRKIPGSPLNIQVIGESKVKIGEITIDKVKRSISFPVHVEIRDQMLEYALVHQWGKVHESLLSTKISPKAFHVAVLLLNGEGKHPKVELVWRKNGPDARFLLSDLIQPIGASPKLAGDQWHYKKANLDSKGRLAAQQEGSFITLLNDPKALMLHQVAASLGHDDAYKPFTQKLPSKGVPVRMIITFPTQ